MTRAAGNARRHLDRQTFPRKLHRPPVTPSVWLHSSRHHARNRTSRRGPERSLGWVRARDGHSDVDVAAVCVLAAAPVARDAGSACGLPPTLPAQERPDAPVAIAGMPLRQTRRSVPLNASSDAVIARAHTAKRGVSAMIAPPSNPQARRSETPRSDQKLHRRPLIGTRRFRALYACLKQLLGVHPETPGHVPEQAA